MDHWFLISSLSSQLEGACTPERWELLCRLSSHCTEVMVSGHLAAARKRFPISGNLSKSLPGQAGFCCKNYCKGQ